ncbi:melanocyte protein PMEL isoform X2 [Microcaecilia unicolor]|uniref:Melanocyte protein PMEL isoform X2 n=1 Tax=Microcaecilia unicolor TaxID=1415580 RepID=A0A6P7XQC0_9AMPH|nr:melanocyte protein PMEL isoform X2 [Microcaecilia unicolor]
MHGFWWVAILCVLLTGTTAQNRAGQRDRGRGKDRYSHDQPPAVTSFKTWNSWLYPVWQEGDPRQRDCWKGGPVMLEVNNDAPTLASAKVTFSINLQFPHNQTVLSNGQVVWSQNHTANGKYWQVVDGPSSLLTVDTEDAPLGSYTMEVIVYHHRGRQQFIPLGKAASQFSIIDQIPLSVEIFQIMDPNQTDNRFVQNRAISFQVKVHDPSEYLKDADLTYSWDFGDQSGTLISHTETVTHTYTTAGSFKSQLVLQAAIPLASCSIISTWAVVVVASTEPAGQQSPGTAVVTGGTSAIVTAQGQTTATGASPAASPSDQPATPTMQEPAAETLTITASASSVPNLVTPAAGSMVPAAAATPSVAVPANIDLAATVEGSGTSLVDMDLTLLPAPEATAASLPVSAAADSPILPSVVGTEADVDLSGSPETAAATTEVQLQAVTAAPGLLNKRQAPEEQSPNCFLYRYGSFSADLEIEQGIESVEIVQVLPVAAEGQDNAVDFTVTCQGSVPQEACTIISDPDCLTSQKTLCGPVEPSPDCQLVLRQVFSDSGVYCVNVSLTNDVSLVMASTQVIIGKGSDASPLTGAAWGIAALLVVGALVVVAYTYRHTQKYSSLPTDATQPSTRRWIIHPSPLFLFFRQIVSRPMSGESRPLLHGSSV